MWKKIVFNIKTCFFGKRTRRWFSLPKHRNLRFNTQHRLDLLNSTLKLDRLDMKNLPCLIYSAQWYYEFHWVSMGDKNSSTSQHGAWQKRTVFMLAILEPRKANYDFFRNHFAGVNCYKEALNWNGFEIGSTSFQKYVHKNCKSISYDVYCIQALRMQNIYI